MIKLIILIIILLVTFMYCESSWKEIIMGKSSYKFITNLMKFIAGVNIFLAFTTGSKFNIVIFSIITFYIMVIYKHRIYKIILEEQQKQDHEK